MTREEVKLAELACPYQQRLVHCICACRKSNGPVALCSVKRLLPARIHVHNLPHLLTSWHDRAPDSQSSILAVLFYH